MVQDPSRATAILCSIQHLLRMDLVGIQSEQWERLADEGSTLKWKKNRLNLWQTMSL